jgi:hypothetical protein
MSASDAPKGLRAIVLVDLRGGNHTPKKIEKVALGGLEAGDGSEQRKQQPTA